MQSTRKRTLIGAAVGSLATLVLAGALVVPLIANAQDAAPTTEPPAAESVEASGRTRGESDSALAEALGITVEELAAARTAAQEAAITQAVADGLITEAQAEELRSEGSGRGFSRRWLGDVDADALLAAALGISEDALETARDAVYEARVAAAVADGSLTQEEADLALARSALRDYLAPLVEQSITDGIAAAVTAGIITQEQADTLTADGAGFGLPGGRGFGGGLDMGGRGGHGGMRGGEGDMGTGMGGGRGMRGGSSDSTTPAPETTPESSGASS